MSLLFYLGLDSVSKIMQICGQLRATNRYNDIIFKLDVQKTTAFNHRVTIVSPFL